MSKANATRRQRNTRRSIGRRWAVEALEGRAMLSVAAETPLLVQWQSGGPLSAQVAGAAAAAHAPLQPTGIPGLYQAQGDPQVLAQLAASLQGQPGVKYAQLARGLQLDKTPNDPSFTNGTMWGLSGGNGINAPAAWDVTTGSTKVVVADIDTGIDYNHPDLYQNIWLNNAEIPASRKANLTDVDGDGLITFYDLNQPANIGPGKITDINGDGRIDAADVLAPMGKNADGSDNGTGGWADGISQDGDTAHLDDLVGWNFVSNTNNPMDDHGHGTHTSGTIGAMGNNGVGVVGVNWTVQIMALKFLDNSGNGSDLDAALALRYATDHGARVSSNSYGGGDGGTALSDAITYAQQHNDVFVAAAGNSSANNDTTPNYPSNYPQDNVVAVAAIDSGGALASFSNYGATTVDLAAPGVSIESTLPNNQYASWSGTSMATPHVAGAAALVLAKNPTWTYQQVINQLLSTVTPNANLKGKTVTGGVLNIGAALNPAATSKAAATFAGTDSTTQGSWKGVYGTEGYNVLGDASSYPAYATVTATGQSSYTWAASTTDARALQKSANGSTDRIAGTWYANNGFSIDLNLTDGQPHRVSAYLLDWDGNNSRSERIDVIDAATNAVLDTRTVSSFSGGRYVSWDLTGHVQLKVTPVVGQNAVLSGLFFGYIAPPTTSNSAKFVGTDGGTQGTWKGVYGTDGYNVVGDAASYPSYVTVTPSGQASYTWAASTADVRALQKPASGATDRVAGTWYANAGFSIDLGFNDHQAHRVSAYLLDWDGNGTNTRTERIDVVDPDTNTVLDTRTVSSFVSGEYLSWDLSGHVQIKVTPVSGSNAVLSGLFFGYNASNQTGPSGTASFVGLDATTQGNWKGAYGADGYNVLGDASSYPAYVTVNPSGQGAYTWAASTTDARALQKSANGSTDRVAATWYGGTFSVDLNLTDGQAHRVSAYLLDWDANGRTEHIDVVDAATGAVLDSRDIGSFAGGKYATWDLSGHVQLRITALSGPNAVLSGLFFQPRPSA